MSATVIQLPGSAPAPSTQPTGLNLTADQLIDASGGYLYPARQLRELHARGFSLAYIGKNNRVVLPRAHYEAVLRGDFQSAAKAEHPARQAPSPNRAALMEMFGQKRKK